jgi:hypothetical protein
MRIASLVLVLLAATAGGCSKSTSPSDAGASGAGLGGAGGRAGAGGQGGSSGSTGCAPACGEQRECCVDHCVNLQNDPQNCGTCGEHCPKGTYCGAGQCVAPPCDATCGGGTSCCAAACCAAGQLCCDPQGPLDMGPRCLDPNEHGTCPLGCAPLCICADPETPIATQSGNRPLASLRVGDLVYSIDRGQLAIVPIIRTHREPVAHHHVVRLTLRSGSVLQISPGHPTADGRRFEQLTTGALLDGVEITSAELVPYQHDATYDILPDSDTGAYFAGGVLIGSTLAESPRFVAQSSTPFEPVSPAFDRAHKAR